MAWARVAGSGGSWPCTGPCSLPAHWLVAIEMGRWMLYSGWVVTLAVWWCRLALEVFKYPRGS